MLSIRALVYAGGSEFGKYMPRFYKYLEIGLQNFKEYQVFALSVEVVGDVCRALGDKILPFCDGIMSHLLTGLSSGVMHPSVTPLIVSCFGDIGIAIGEQFEKYLPCAMPMILVASEIFAKTDTDNNYGNQLRRGIFDAYSGILRGLKNSNSDLMLPHVGHLLQAIELVFRDKMREESVSKAAVAAMGDLAHTLGPRAKTLFKDRPFYADFLQECLDSDDYKMKELAAWAQKMIESVFVCGRPGTKRRKLLVSYLK
ncbi:hypothetical protein MKW94_009936 [Papaver nudicaule]|uniref:Importin subunit beta-1/Transportin-1-like TPR repeats domain-containing protein n=1 Tax=Papaver nudicaule TaxID=74823 RepID=A0AA41SJ21_PAPNU|nr:hypothetical protein [Papaver nudicaule]MCL7035348.1 hypothetical protein [Papaver nudicaule]